MPNFVFAYRMPTNYRPGSSDTRKQWADWFAGLSDHVVVTGNPVINASSLGDASPNSRLGGYSIVSADDMDAARALAADCPALTDGGGVEIGELTELP